jgi:hypothetical protein
MPAACDDTGDAAGAALLPAPALPPELQAAAASVPVTSGIFVWLTSRMDHLPP